MPRWFLAAAALAGLWIPMGQATAAAQSKSASAPKRSSSSSSVQEKGKSSPAKKAPAKRRTATRSRGQASPTADRIREIQTALAAKGHYQGQPTGKWDAGTTTAMRNFQEAQGLKGTGKLDAISLQRLGLGSPVAGLAAPRNLPGATPSTN